MADPLSSDRMHETTDEADWPGVQRAIRTYVLGRVKRPDLADDIAQETVARLIEYSQTRKIATIYGYGFRIARNLLTKQNAAPLDDEAVIENHMSEDPLPDHVVAVRQEAALVSRLLRRMPRLRREVLVRRRIRGESCAKIAQDLNMSAKAVEKHITRGLRDLNDALGKGDLHE